MQLYTIDTGLFKLDGGAMHGVVPKSLWNKLNPADENNMCSWAMRCLLIEQNNRLILVDTGIGNKQDEKFFGHYYLHGNDSLEGSIKKHGFALNDITDVFLTHLHFDHVGGAVKRAGERLVPTFEKATYWSNKAHWDWAVHPNDREKASFLKENILPLEESGQLQFIETKEGEEWLPDFRIRYVQGHTEAMMLPQLRYKDKTILYAADLLPSMHHIPLPWIMGYDMRPLDTLNEKKRLLGEAAAGDWLFFFEHDYKNELCSIQQTDKGIRSHEVLRLAEL
ncbi:MBL fold metallo-hydrolase [Taibaiella helva]|uniref:MBL fold metallo-hydrolase n=1 Tax=Taibaiella helva TaxID=2301235 RepID=UPI000E57C4D2|nr:MBL fold metallo-hydrolase [Taibaiella helva]